MKHIKRNFLNELTKSDFEEIEKNRNSKIFTRGMPEKSFKDYKTTENNILIIKTANNFYIKGFLHKINGHSYAFPEPDPTLIYFSNAQQLRREIEAFKKKLLPKLDPSSNCMDDFTHDYYSFFGAVCGTIIFLFTSLESFMNSLIAETDNYERKSNVKKEIFNFLQIQDINFDEKIKTVIPQLKIKDFIKAHPTKAQHIENLKVFRNNIIHTKSTNKNIKHDFVIKRAFSFQYDLTIMAIAEYMNYYKPNYVLECGCEKDF